MQNVWSLLGVFAAAVLILYLAYLATKWIGTRSAPGSAAPFSFGGGMGTFRILAQIAVGRNERLVLIRMGEECCLFGVTEREITLLRTYKSEEAESWLTADEGIQPNTFLDALKASLRKK